MNQTDNISKDLTPLLGLSDLPEAEQEEFLDEVGGVVMESALLNFLSTLEPAEQAEFEAFLSEAGEGEELLSKLIEAYPLFLDALKMQIDEFKKETIAVLGDGE